MLFLDEIHRMSRPAEEMLYLAMEDFRVDVIVGKGPGATAIPLEIPPFTLVGATTRAGLLPGPLRDRFGFTAHLEFYEAADLERILHRSPGCSTYEVQPTARRDRRPVPRHPADRQPAAAPGPRLRPGPRRRRRHHDVAREALLVYEVDERAWTGSTGRCSTALVGPFGGGPVGVSTLAVAVGEERETVEEVAEPFLVRAGYLARTPRGRVATPAAWAHLGPAPAGPRNPPTFADRPVRRSADPDAAGAGRRRWDHDAAGVVRPRDGDARPPVSRLGQPGRRLASCLSSGRRHDPGRIILTWDASELWTPSVCILRPLSWWRSTS